MTDWRHDPPDVDPRDEGRRIGREGWRRGRVRGGFGSQFDAWSSGVGFAPAGFGFGPQEHPDRDRADDRHWSPPPPLRWSGGSQRHPADDHRGRGPREYRRADERVRDGVCERLTDDWAVDATDIQVQVSDGEVTLTGAIPSREQKRRATDCAERVYGVRDVFNQLRIAGAGSR